MWVEILAGDLRNKWKREDLKRIIDWSNEDRNKEGILRMRYFLSEDQDNFVMLVEYKSKEKMETLRRQWDGANVEQQEWFQEMMSKVFKGGRSKYYEEIEL